MMKVLIVGDENLTFTLDYVALHESPSYEVEACLCLGVKDYSVSVLERASLLAYGPSSSGIEDHATTCEGYTTIHFGVNPCQLSKKISSTDFDRIVCVLPGLAFDGFPPAFSLKSDFFKLRLHMFLFSLIKSSRSVVNASWLWNSEDYCGPEIHTVWPDVNDTSLHFETIDPDRLAIFCGCSRREGEEFSFPLGQYPSWKPIFCGEEVIKSSSWLQSLKVYVFNFARGAEEGSKDVHDCNILKIPFEITKIPLEELSSVNDLFQFSLIGVDSTVTVVSKLSLRYDPRVTGWRNDGSVSASSMNPLRMMQRGNGRSVSKIYPKMGYHPPSDPTNMPPDARHMIDMRAPMYYSPQEMQYFFHMMKTYGVFNPMMMRPQAGNIPDASPSDLLNKMYAKDPFSQMQQQPYFMPPPNVQHPQMNPNRDNQTLPPRIPNDNNHTHHQDENNLYERGGT